MQTLPSNLNPADGIDSIAQRRWIVSLGKTSFEDMAFQIMKPKRSSRQLLAYRLMQNLKIDGLPTRGSQEASLDFSHLASTPKHTKSQPSLDTVPERELTKWDCFPTSEAGHKELRRLFEFWLINKWLTPGTSASWLQMILSRSRKKLPRHTADTYGDHFKPEMPDTEVLPALVKSSRPPGGMHSSTMQ